MSYIGRSSDGFGLLNKYRWVASGGETSISPSLTDSNGNQLRFTDKNLVILFKNGTKLDQTAYNLDTANTISGLTALSASDILEAHVYDTFSIATLDTVPTSGGTFTGNVNVSSTADNGPILSLVSNDHSDAANWATEGIISFKADNDANEETEFANIKLVTADVTDGSENGRLRVSLLSGGGSPVNSYQFAADKLFLEHDSHTIRWNNTRGTNYEVELITATPTASRTITLPNADGTVITTGNMNSITDIGIQQYTIQLGAGANLEFEGATGNAHETTLTVTDPTQDNTITLPDATGQVVLSSGAIDTNASARIGRAWIGHVGFSDYAGFCHLDQVGNYTYALIQGSNGSVYLNAPTSQSINIRNNNTDVASFYSGGLLLKEDKVILFEGATDNAYETTLTVTDPTADRTITLPNVSGTVITTGNSDTPTTTTSSGDADFVLVDDGGTMKKITPANLGIGGGGVALDDITAGDAASTLSTTTGDISVVAQENIELRAKDSTTSVIWQNGYDNYYPKFKIYRASHGSAPQTIGKLSFNGTVRPSSGTGDTESELAAITTRGQNVTTGEEDGDVAFTVKRNGSMKTVMSLDVSRTDWPHDGGIELGQDMDICWIGGGNSSHGTFLTVADGNPYSQTADSTIILPSVNGTVITTGNADDSNGTYGFTTNVRAKTNDGAILKLQRHDYTVYNNNVLGGIEFSAPVEQDGGLGAGTAASMQAISNGAFSATANNTDLVFKLGDGAAPSEKVRFTHGGNIALGENGGGIDFSNHGHHSGMTSELLNDYELGTWTPSQSVGGNSSISASDAHYVKIGRMLYFTCVIAFSGSDVDRVSITGLPFNATGTSAVSAFFSGGPYDHLKLLVSGNTILGSNTNGDASYTSVNGMTARFSGTYMSST